MSKLFEYMHQLYNLELYDDIVFLHEMIPQNDECLNLSPKNKALVTVYVADAYAELNDFSKSVERYEKALELYKLVPRGMVVKNFTEADIRFRCHKAYIKMSLFDEALNCLYQLPEDQIVPKIQIAIAKLRENESQSTHLQQLRTGNFQLSLEHYKKAFEAVPSGCALWTLSKILKTETSVPLHEKHSADSVDLERMGLPHEIQIWLNSMEELGNCNTQRAARTLIYYTAPSAKVLVEHGRIYHHLGDDEMAVDVLMKAFISDKTNANGMDLLAALLYNDRATRGIGAPLSPPSAAEKEKQLKDLEAVATRLMNRHPDAEESWIAFGYLARSQSKPPKALYFAQKACEIGYLKRGIPSVEAFLLKIHIFIDTDRTKEAVAHVNEALKYYGRNIDLYEIFIYIHSSKGAQGFREMCNMVKLATANYPKHPRVQLIKAFHMLLSNAATSKTKEQILNNRAIQEAQMMLENLIDEYPFMTNVLFPLVELYERTGRYEQATDILKKVTDQGMRLSAENQCRLKLQLSQLFTKMKCPTDAFYCLTGIKNGEAEIAGQMQNIDAGLIATQALLSPVQHPLTTPTGSRNAPAPPPPPPVRGRGRQRVPATPSATPVYNDSPSMEVDAQPQQGGSGVRRTSSSHSR